MFRAVSVVVLALFAIIVQDNYALGSDQQVLVSLEGEARKLEYVTEKAANHCTCIEYNCGCCAHLVEKEIRLDSTICANATYLKRDYGFSLTVTFNKFTVFNETMSLRNPPPVCMGAPFVKEFAEVCVKIYDIQASAAHLHACVEAEARLKHIHVAKYELGCFDMTGESLRRAVEQLENEIL
ncbi:uncharacterized protein LOC117641828 [Thrips palmi]|uniref:Uncharacterized protein LOC117641828 n=1 Tax=Thrips palmi TaxID=161013 RepID=A0A6P8Y6W5_THRPL|nr:uncharacterized protein LOC117641828 [Thrips palmi]